MHPSLLHTVTRSPVTYARLLLIALAVATAVIFLPKSEGALLEFLDGQARNLTVLYAILVGFIAAEILSRRRKLDEHVAVELNKIRRVYHLSKHLADANPGLKPWFTDVEKQIKKYLGTFVARDFREYDKGSRGFRNITYAVYAVPFDKMKYGHDMYASLLNATESATEAREFIRQALVMQYVGQFAWIVLFVVSCAFGAFLILGTPDELAYRLATSLTVFTLFLVMQMIYEYGHTNERKAEFYASLYRDDLKRIGIKENGKS
jgi:lipopolysaccharide export LptBFGC system permease protein LptF